VLSSRLRPPHESTQVISQINGGIIQGISYTLLGKSPARSGLRLMVNPDLEQYKIVGSENPRHRCAAGRGYIGQSPRTPPVSAKPPGLSPSAAVATLFTTLRESAFDELP